MITYGPAGAAGTRGSTWTTGNTVPLDAVGLDGDMFLDLDSATRDVYQRTAGVWTKVCELLPA